MARGSGQAQTAGNSGNGFASSDFGNAQSLYGTLAPELESQAAHPAGFAPSDLAAQNTAAQQSAGGTQSAATGQAGLLAARTRNSGAASAATGKAARTGGELASEGALGTQIKNAQLKNQQQQQAQSGLASLYGTTLGGSNNALGEVANNVNANTEAANASWDWAKYILDPAMGGAATAAAGMK